MIRLHFEKLSRYDRILEPCTCAIPFAQAELYDTTKAAILDGDLALPVQCKVTAKWPDGSVKWLLVSFLIDLPGNRAKDVYFITDHETTLTPKDEVTIQESSGRLHIMTGELSLQLSMPGEKGLFYHIRTKDTEYRHNTIEGPVIYNSQEDAFALHVGKNGWEILEQGPIFSVVQTRGKHYNLKQEGFIDYILRIYAYSGKPWIRMDYTIINKEEGEAQNLSQVVLRMKPESDVTRTIHTAMATSNYTSTITQGYGDEKLYHCIDAAQLIFEANEHIPETFYGTFWADWNQDQQGGICATIYQAHQNFPKAMEVDREGITLSILPKESSGLKLLQGVGKTHRLFLHFHGPTEELQMLNVRSLQLQMPDRPVLEPQVYERSGIFDRIFVKEKVSEVESSLISLADSRGKAYGILHWGDAPDPGYTQQGRGNGEPVWTNNEYDFPHAAMLMYARTSERRMLDYLLVTAEHWMDVDVCHYSPDPLRHHAQITHSAYHATGGVEISHEWVEGLLDYYHMTGEEIAKETAFNIGENILYHLSQPRYQKKGEINARETGWALRSLIALYHETYDEKWLAYADSIVGHFQAWKEEYGGWLSPYTDHTSIRVPFMISVAVGSLMRYYRVKPEERIKNLILEAVNDMVENCILDNGLFYYKELPSLRRLGNNTLVLEALANAYELTKDTAYLRYGLPTFIRTVKNERTTLVFPKQVRGDAIILQGAGPKGFAQSFYPIVTFYAAACAEGLLGSL